MLHPPASGVIAWLLAGTVAIGLLAGVVSLLFTLVSGGRGFGAVLGGGGGASGRW